MLAIFLYIVRFIIEVANIQRELPNHKRKDCSQRPNPNVC